MRVCPCGCEKSLIGKQKYHSQACQKRVWRMGRPSQRSAVPGVTSKAPKPTAMACRSCSGWLAERDRPFVCGGCADDGRDAELLKFALLDDPTRSVMVYFGFMNMYSRKMGTQTEIICGVPDVRPVLRWLMATLGGDTLRDDTVLAIAVPTRELVEMANVQAGVRQACLAA